MLDNKTALVRVLKIEFREFCVDLSLKVITSIFSHAGFVLSDEAISNGTRRGLVDDFYEAEDWGKVDAIQKLFKAIEYALQVYYLDEGAKEYLRALCRDNGLCIEADRIIGEGLFGENQMFSHQFPAGLPFGVPKPSFSIKAAQGAQTLKYELQDNLGLLEGNIYPDFTFRQLESNYGLDASTNNVLKNALVGMNQTEYEKNFFLAYAKKFRMADEDIPVLIPQAWIQWHSQSKKNLRSITASHSDDLYRVDFVAFWNRKRYVILIDDISHYAVRKQGYWLADQESYSKRLKEDRKLQKENWQVFRVSNWELRSSEKTQAALEDLREFIQF